MIASSGLESIRGKLKMKGIHRALSLGVLILAGAGMCGASQAPTYSLRQLREAGIMPDDTQIHLHALVYQGEHGLIMLDEACKDECNDVLGLDVPAGGAATSFDTAVKRLGTAMGCCNTRKAYFDMLVTIRFLDHPRTPESPGPDRVRLLSKAVLVKVIRATSDTPSHWLATHK